MLTASEAAKFRERPAEMAAFFAAVRKAGGDVPLRVTSGDRTRADTLRIQGAAIGGCHERGMAMDVVPLTDDREAWVRRINAAIDSGQLRVGEFFWYPFDGHAHLTLPPCGGNNERLVKVGAETPFTSLVAWLSRGGAVASSVPLILGLVFALILFLGGGE